MPRPEDLKSFIRRLTWHAVRMFGVNIKLSVPPRGRDLLPRLAPEKSHKRRFAAFWYAQANHLRLFARAGASLATAVLLIFQDFY